MLRLYSKILILCFILSNGMYAFQSNYSWQSKDNRSNAEAGKSSTTPKEELDYSPQKVTVGSDGKFGVNLPLITIPGRGGLHFNIKMSYAPGIKVTQEASWVGLGWDLNIGSITRTNLGIMDNNITEYYYNDPKIGYTYDDAWRDIYYINFPGGSGKIYQYRPSGNNYEFKTEEWRQWKITYDNIANRFIVITENGTTYVFGLYLEGATSNTKIPGSTPPRIPIIPSKQPFYKWNLTAILSSDYEDGGGDLYDPMDGAVTNNKGNWIGIIWRYDESMSKKKFLYTTRGQMTNDTTNNYSISHPGISILEESYPKYIITPTHVAVFTTEVEERNPISELLDEKWIRYSMLDWPFGSYFYDDPYDYFREKKRRLKTISLYRKDNSGGSPSGLGTALRQVELAYQKQTDYTPTQYHELRTILNSVKITAGEVALNPYHFTYYNHLGNVDPFSTDVNGVTRAYAGAFKDPKNHRVGNWGYYNSKTSSFLGDDLQWIFNEPTTQQDEARLWNLKRITYPTNGYVEYDYEMNKYVVDYSYKGSGDGNYDINRQAFGGGPRLKSQNVYDGELLKTYTYNYATSKSDGNYVDNVGRLFADPIEYYSAVNGIEAGRNVAQPPQNNWIYEQTSHPVLYEKITENQPDGSNITSYYSVAKLDENIWLSGSPTTAQIFSKTLGKRGYLVKEQYFNAAIPSPQLIKQYDINRTEPIKTDNEFIPGLTFSFWKSQEVLTNTIYDENGQNPVSTIVTNVFNADNGLLQTKTETNSDGVQKITDIDYAFNHESMGINRNMYSQVYATTIRSGNDVKSKVFTSWWDYGILEQVWRPRSEWVWKGDGTPNDVTAPSVADDVENKCVISSNAYDSFGNVLESQDANGVVTKIQYSYNSTVAIGVFNNTGTLTGNLPALAFVFDDGSTSGWTGSYGSWSMIDGTYKQSNGTDINVWGNPKYNNTASIDDAIVEADVRFDNSGSYRYAAISKYISSSNFVRFELRKSNNQVMIYTIQNGNGASWTAPCTFNENQWYHLKGEINGTKANLYLDGKLMLSVDHAYINIGSGYPALHTYATVARFDNVRFYPVDAIATSTTYSDQTLLPISTIDENGVTTHFEYDGMGRVTASKTNQGYYLNGKSYSSDLTSTTTTNYHYPNLVRNCSFESSFSPVPNEYKPYQWTIDNDEVGSWVASVEGVSTWYGWGINYEIEGPAALFFSLGDPTGERKIKQNVGRLYAGKTYTASVYFARLNISSSYVTAKISLKNISGTVGNSNQATVNVDGWNKLTVTFTPSADDEYFLMLHAPTNTDEAILYDFVTLDDGSIAQSIQNPVLTNATTNTDQFQKPLSASKYIEAGKTISLSQSYDNMNRIVASYKPSMTGETDPAAPYHFTKTEYYTDPLGRVKHIHPPGSTFHSEGGNKFVTLNYGRNSSVLSFAGVSYPANTLFSTTTTDENGIQSVQYIDKLGNTVASINNANTGGLSLTTQYEYDIIGKVKKSIPPKGNDYRSEYVYNPAGQLISKSSQDDGLTQYLYDNNGKLRFVKDANHQGTSPNAVNNITGLIFGSGVRTRSIPLTMPGKVTINLSAYGEGADNITAVIATTGGTTLLTYAVNSSLGSGSSSIVLPKGTYNCTITSTSSDPGYEYDYNVYCTTGYEMIYNKYDSFERLIEQGEYESSTVSGNFTQANAINTLFPASNTFATKKLFYDAPSTSALAAGQRNLKGRLSYSYAYRLGGICDESYYSYNDLGLVEWIVKYQHGYYAKKLVYEYDLQGNVIKRGYVDLQGSKNMYTFYEYDQADRIVRVYTGTNANGTGKVQEAAYSYTASSKVKTQVFGSSIQTVDYTYNERDWLSMINNVDAISSDKFAEKLHYFTTPAGVTATPQYNGNISSMESYTPAIGAEEALGRMAYSFTYDGASRLKKAQNYNYTPIPYGSTAAWTMPNLAYDANGNMDTLQRNNGAGLLMDNFKYNYQANTNRLTSIAGSMTATYAYDANGNMQSDSYRGIGFIIYDINNYPVDVYKTNGERTIYSYDVNGDRVRKYNIGGADTYYMIGPDGKTEMVQKGVYNNNYTYNILGNDNFGQILVTSSTASRYYYLKDHLGNNRVTLNSTGTVIGYEDYYPFGMVMDGRSSTSSADARYKFTGKERDVESGYDYFGARYYDSKIGRWLAVDPLKGKYPNISPYVYTHNDPIGYLDPNGLEELRAISYARENLMDKSYRPGLSYLGGGRWKIKNEDNLVCNEFVARAYYGAGYKGYPAEMELQVEWFKNNNWFTTDATKGEVGDVMFFGDIDKPGKRHEVIISEVNEEGKYRIAHSGKSGSKEYSTAKWRTASEIGKVFAGGKRFVGIGSVMQLKKKEDNYTEAPADATAAKTSFKQWVNDSQTIWQDKDGHFHMK